VDCVLLVGDCSIIAIIVVGIIVIIGASCWVQVDVVLGQKMASLTVCDLLNDCIAYGVNIYLDRQLSIVSKIDRR